MWFICHWQIILFLKFNVQTDLICYQFKQPFISTKETQNGSLGASLSLSAFSSGLFKRLPTLLISVFSSCLCKIRSICQTGPTGIVKTSTQYSHVQNLVFYVWVKTEKKHLTVVGFSIRQLQPPTNNIITSFKIMNYYWINLLNFLQTSKCLTLMVTAII